MIFELSGTEINVDGDETYLSDAEELILALLRLHGYE